MINKYILYEIAKYLDVKEILNLSITSKYCYYNLLASEEFCKFLLKYKHIKYSNNIPKRIFLKIHKLCKLYKHNGNYNMLFTSDKIKYIYKNWYMLTYTTENKVVHCVQKSYNHKYFNKIVYDYSIEDNISIFKSLALYNQNLKRYVYYICYILDNILKIINCENNNIEYLINNVKKYYVTSENILILSCDGECKIVNYNLSNMSTYIVEKCKDIYVDDNDIVYCLTHDDKIYYFRDIELNCRDRVVKSEYNNSINEAKCLGKFENASSIIYASWDNVVCTNNKFYDLRKKKLISKYSNITHVVECLDRTFIVSNNKLYVKTKKNKKFTRETSYYYVDSIIECDHECDEIYVLGALSKYF